jgi:hypothetical protein
MRTRDQWIRSRPISMPPFCARQVLQHNACRALNAYGRAAPDPVDSD